MSSFLSKMARLVGSSLRGDPVAEQSHASLSAVPVSNVPFERIVSDGRDSAIAALGENQSKAVKPRMMQFYRHMDDALAKASVASACQKGCDFCCNYLVRAMPPEVFALAEHVNQLPALDRARVRERLSDYNARTALMSDQEHEHTNIPCVFLEDGECSVYSLRPLACRGHHSMDAGPCERTYVDPSRDELSPKDPYREAVRFGFPMGLGMMLQERKLGAELVELHAALADALAGGTSFKRWRNGKQAFGKGRT